MPRHDRRLAHSDFGKDQLGVCVLCLAFGVAVSLLIPSSKLFRFFVAT
jgi:hypothetical protein